MFLRGVAGDAADRRSIVEHGAMHVGPLLVCTGEEAVSLVTRCGCCGAILTQGVPEQVVKLAVWHCACGVFNEMTQEEHEEEEAS